MELDPTVATNRHQVYRVSWLRAKARFNRWEEEVELLEHELKWTMLWFDHQKTLWAKRADESEQMVLQGHACYAWKQVQLWEKMAAKTSCALKDMQVWM